MNGNNNILEFKSIAELKGYEFIIPSYQRGYRWKERQVEDLLNDIWDFAKEQKSDDEFYCLQPVVVKKLSNSIDVDLVLNDKKKTIVDGTIKIKTDPECVKEFKFDSDKNSFLENNTFEVIDGQQRLTTIYLILHYLENKGFYTIKYDTRKETTACLEDPKSNQGETIDISHIKQAYETIKNWFEEKNGKTFSSEALLKQTKVIWYLPEEVKEKDGDSESIELFTRLNMGKIPLTNSELIRALFIHKTKSLSSSELNSYKIASEWDFIEQQLHNEAFWTFVTLGKPFDKEYPNRIEILFDLIEDKNGGSKIDDKYSTFRMYNDWINNYEKSVQELWLEVKNYYYRLNEWFIDDELYHLIGYIRFFNKKSLNELLALADDIKQSELKCELRNIIGKEVEPGNLWAIEYGNEKIKKALLLHNIATYKKLELRFPFKRYIEEKWDIEHIHARADNVPNDKRKIFMKQWIEYFEKFKAEEQIKELKEYFEKFEKCDKNAEDLQNDLFSKFKNECDRLEESIENNLSNLVLLDQNTNRSYKNAPYPFKRKKIIDVELDGRFIPICTKNVFTKCYSDNPESMIWGQADRDNYIDNMTTMITEYLKIKSKETK